MADSESPTQKMDSDLVQQIPSMHPRAASLPLAEVQRPSITSPAPGTTPSSPKTEALASVPDTSKEKEKNVRFNTPPPSPPPLLRRTTGHLPERKLGSTSSIELDSEISPVSPLTLGGATPANNKHAETSPPTTPERERKPSVTTPPSDRTLRRTSESTRISPTSTKKLPFSAVDFPDPRAKISRKRTDDLPIPVSPTERPISSHPDHDLPIPTPTPGEEKIPIHPTHTNSTTVSTTSTFIENPTTTPGIAVPAPKSHKHPEGSTKTTGEAGYKGRLWSDWHWYRNQDLPVPPPHQPGVTEAELEQKKYVSPYPKPAGLEEKDGEGKDWKQELESAAGWAKVKIGEWGRKLNENMHYGGENGRGRRRREDNVSFK